MVQLSEDRLLVRQFKQGDQHAYKMLYQQYAPRLLAFSKKYLQSTEDAEEIVQEVFIRIWEKRDNVDENQSFSSYIFQAAKNRIFNGFRKMVNAQAYLDFVLYSNPTSINHTEQEVEYREVEAKAKEAVAGMPPKRREIFLLSREQGLKNREIAEKLNISIKTVENQMGQALKYLKNELKEYQISASLIPIYYLFQEFIGK